MNNSIYLNLSENSILFNTNLTTIFTPYTTQLPSPQSPAQTPVPKWYESGRVQIPLYSIIFLLAVIGNSLVILTLVQNKRMRTITNVFLLNLAISDLLLGVLCMPFTLVGTLLRNFIFGEFMCKLLPYLQASSVSVSSWTLVAISVERYYAICHPLRSRRWQTLNHSYKLIFIIWTLSLTCMIPIAALSQLKPTNKGHHKCREDWPSIDYERAYTLFLDIILLILPLLFLSVTYSLIVITLWKGFQNEQPQISSKQQTNKNNSTNSEQQPPNNGYVEVFLNSRGSTRSSISRQSLPLKQSSSHHQPSLAETKLDKANSFDDSIMYLSNIRDRFATSRNVRLNQLRQNWSQESATSSSGCSSSFTTKSSSFSNKSHHHHSSKKRNKSHSCGITGGGSGCAGSAGGGLRRTNVEKNLHNKKRIIQMLFVVILEFFICWTPLYVINTIALFNPKAIYIGLGYTAISFFQLLAYSSSCCNPITYCFMNCGFRKSFLNLFGCLNKVKKHRQNQMTTIPDRDRFVNSTVAVGAVGIASEIDSTAMVKWTTTQHHQTQNQSNLILGHVSTSNNMPNR